MKLFYFVIWHLGKRSRAIRRWAYTHGFPVVWGIRQWMDDDWPVSKTCTSQNGVLTKERRTVSDGEGTNYYECSSCEDPADPKEEPYEPRIGDRVSLEGSVVATGTKWFSVRFDGSREICVLEDDERKHAKLLSRRRTLTKEEAERLLSEKLGEQITIE